MEYALSKTTYGVPKGIVVSNPGSIINFSYAEGLTISAAGADSIVYGSWVFGNVSILPYADGLNVDISHI